MDANHCADADTIDLYVLNRLGEAASASLEEHILLCSECMRRVEITVDFVDGLRAAAALDGRQQPSPERRLESRVKVNQGLELCDQTGGRICCQAVDSSPHGLGVLSPLRVPAGTRVKVLIRGVEKPATVKFCAPLHADNSAYRLGLSCG